MTCKLSKREKHIGHPNGGQSLCHTTATMLLPKINLFIDWTTHAHMIAFGFKPFGHILNRLMDIYCKSSNIAYALHLFNKIPKPDIGARMTLIALYCGESKVGLRSIWWNPTQYARHSSFYSFVICYLICFLTAFFRIPLILKIIKKRKRKGQNNVVLSP